MCANCGEPYLDEETAQDVQELANDRYRYTEWGSEKMAELYDHQTDPHEFTNLVNDPKSGQTLAEMQKLLKGGWQAALPTVGAVRNKAGGR